MFEKNGKNRNPIWVNFVVVTLLLVTTGFTITGCAKTKSESESAKPVGQSTKPAGQSTKQKKTSQPTKATQQKDVPADKIEETTVDDDPE